jgi:hypothetical protein
MDPLTLSLIIGGASMATNAIRGGIQARKAKKLEAEFDAKDKALEPVSAEQYSYLNRVRQMQRSMAMGTDPTSAMAQRGLSQSLAQTQGNIARLGTGASTVSGLLRAQQGYNMGMGQVAGQAFDQSRAYMEQEQGLIDNIQKSIYGLQMKRRNYAQIKAVGMRQDASDSATAAIAGLGQMATMIPNKVGGGDVANAGKSAAKSVTNPATVTPNYLKSVTPTVNQQIMPRVQQTIAQDVGPVNGVVGPTGAALQGVLDYRNSVQNWNAPYELGMNPPERIGF